MERVVEANVGATEEGRFLGIRFLIEIQKLMISELYYMLLSGSIGFLLIRILVSLRHRGYS